ncbi:MAG: PAS domain-containing protein [Planctomycetota bacterium]|jgi:PAS domain S-box-containing protein
MTVLLAISLVLQVAAAVLALRLTRVTGRRLAWTLIAAAIFLMAVRRSITLARTIAGDIEHPPDLSAEIVALVISALMVAGIGWIVPLALTQRRVEEVVPQLLESAPDAMVIADDHDRIVLVNAQAVRLFDHRRDELIGSPVEMLLPERFRPAHHARRMEYHKHPRPRVLGVSEEMFGRRKDGSEFPIEISLNPLETAQGNLVVSAIRDVSERREAEKAVKESEGRYRTLLDDVLDESAVGVCILDADRRVVWVNRNFESFFDAPRREVVGADAAALVRERLSPQLEDPQEFCDKLLRAYGDNTYTELFECHILPGEGRWERWLEHRSQPIQAGLYAGGRMEHYTDVTERRLAEQRIRLFADIARTVQIGLLVYRMDDPDDDRTLRVVAVNPEAEHLLGIGKDDLLGRTVDEAFPHLRESEVPQLFAEVVRTGQTREVADFEYGDERVPVNAWSFKAFPLPDRSVGVAFGSVTEQKRAEELISNLAAGVAAETGDPFFRSLVTYLAKSLGLEYAFVGGLDGEAAIRTVAVCDHGKIVENFRYELGGTPCADVVQQTPCCYTEGVQELFPEDKLLRKMRAESYVGSPLLDAAGETIGLIAVLGERKLTNAETARKVLQIFAARAAVELARRRGVSPSS